MGLCVFVIETTIVSKFGSTRQLFSHLWVYGLFIIVVIIIIYKFVYFDQVDTCYPIVWMLYYFLYFWIYTKFITNVYALS